jgi:hypothetical protein
MVVAEPMPGYFSTTPQVLELHVSAGSSLIAVFGQCSYAHRVLSPLMLQGTSQAQQPALLLAAGQAGDRQ